MRHSTLQSFGGLSTENELIPDTKTDKLIPYGDLILDLIPDIKTEKWITDLSLKNFKMQFEPQIWVATAPLVPDGDSIVMLW